MTAAAPDREFEALLDHIRAGRGFDFTAYKRTTLARRFRPDVVLCDLGLPGMDGYAVAAALRRDPATASARLIAVSGYGREEDRERAREAGFDRHLTKPAEVAELEAAIEP